MRKILYSRAFILEEVKLTIYLSGILVIYKNYSHGTAKFTVSVEFFITIFILNVFADNGSFPEISTEVYDNLTQISFNPGAVGVHFQPLSTLQNREQPSRSLILPSSHSLRPIFLPSPHNSIQFPLESRVNPDKDLHELHFLNVVKANPEIHAVHSVGLIHPEHDDGQSLHMPVD